MGQLQICTAKFWLDVKRTRSPQSRRKVLFAAAETVWVKCFSVF